MGVLINVDFDRSGDYMIFCCYIYETWQTLSRAVRFVATAVELFVATVNCFCGGRSLALFSLRQEAVSVEVIPAVSNLEL